MLVHLLTEGIKQLRAVEGASAHKNARLTLWRGMRNVTVPDAFLREGGAEKAPMSTTRDLKTAVRYSASDCSVLLKLDTSNFRERGADLRWVSAFPLEAEVCYPPLTHLMPFGEVHEIDVQQDDGQTAKFIVVEARASFG